MQNTTVILYLLQLPQKLHIINIKKYIILQKSLGPQWKSTVTSPPLNYSWPSHWY